jgi:hypothetical protein
MTDNKLTFAGKEIDDALASFQMSQTNLQSYAYIRSNCCPMCATGASDYLYVLYGEKKKEG